VKEKTKMHNIIALLVLASLAQADGERAGDFEYYVLSLSGPPNW